MWTSVAQNTVLGSNAVSFIFSPRTTPISPPSQTSSRATMMAMGVARDGLHVTMMDMVREEEA